jgi:hypothetical protein
MRSIDLFTETVVTSLIILFAMVCVGQQQSISSSSSTNPSASVNPQKVFVFVQRTDRHVKYSSAEVFHNVLNDLMDYLKSKNVAIAVDEFGGRNHAESATPLDTIFKIASDAKASSVMYVVVDRPLTKWLKITVQCFDLDRKELWREEVSSGGGLSGGHGLEVSTTKLHAQLEKRLGQNGLPILAAAAEPVAEK